MIAITSLSFVKQSPLKWATHVSVDAVKELVQEGASLDLQDKVTTTSAILTSQTFCNTMEPLNEGYTLGTSILSLVEKTDSLTTNQSAVCICTKVYASALALPLV